MNPSQTPEDASELSVIAIRDCAIPLNAQGKAQGQEVSYELHTLGWKAFQDLCATVVSEIWGQTVQVFFSSHDGGRDGAFNGTWKQHAAESFSGSFTIQCKFSSKRDNRLTLKQLEDEIGKAQRLAEKGLANNYFVLSNSSITGTEEEEIRENIKKLPGIENCVVYGKEWFDKTIRECPRLRMLVPRIYGIGDLSQIMDERAYGQANAILSALGEDLGKFVITNPYRQSAKALVDHRFVLLLGEPASGKSTIAATLGVGAIDIWKCSTLKVRDADEFVKHWNPNDPNQFFWIDDAFGVTQLDRDSVLGWNRAFGHLNAALRQGTRVLFTSRDYIYADALNHLKQAAFPLLRQSQVVIHVQDLSQAEKQQILYNHLKRGTQPQTFRTRIKPYLPKLASTRSLLPELARRLGNPFFTERLEISERGLLNFLENPNEFLIETLRPLGCAYRAALALVFMRGGSLASPFSLSTDEKRALELFGSDLAGVIEALKSMKESLVLQVKEGENWAWKFKHPTVRDAFGQIISDERDLMDVYLTGAPLDKLCAEMTCGDVGIQGAKVIVPADRFDRIMIRLNTLDVRKETERTTLRSFLAYRCSSAFLTSYLERHPELIGSLQMQSFMEENPDVNLAATLHKYGLLPNENRTVFAEAIMNLVVEKPDAYVFEEKEVGALLTEEEMAKLLQRLRTELVPNLPAIVDQWEREYEDTDEDVEDFFNRLQAQLSVFTKVLSADTASVALLTKASEAVSMNVQYRIDTRDYDYDGSRGSGSGGGDAGERSIFDDVDA